MASRMNFSIRDNSNEYSNVSLPGVDVTAANFDAQDGLWDTFQTALDGIIIGNIAKRKFLAQDLIINDQQPVNQAAQREGKWLVRYTGNTLSKKYTAEIPTYDSALLLAGTDNMNIGVGAGQTFVTAFEAVVRPTGEAGVTVNSIVHVGRNL
jgi:predicted NAD/FAD-dependent oxidoreductase